MMKGDGDCATPGLSRQRMQRGSAAGFHHHRRLDLGLFAVSRGVRPQGRAVGPQQSGLRFMRRHRHRSSITRNDFEAWIADDNARSPAVPMVRLGVGGAGRSGIATDEVEKVFLTGGPLRAAVERCSPSGSATDG